MSWLLRRLVGLVRRRRNRDLAPKIRAFEVGLGLVELWRPHAGLISDWREGLALDGPVTFVGLERPDGLPAGSEVFTLERLNALVPA